MRVADPPIVSPIESIEPIESAVDDERFRGLADELPQPMVCLDASGAAAWANRAFVGFTGLTLEELNAGGWRGLLHPDERDRSARRFLDGLRGTSPFEAEWRVRRAGDGNFRWMLVRSWPIAREHARWCCIATDVH